MGKNQSVSSLTRTPITRALGNTVHVSLVVVLVLCTSSAGQAQEEPGDKRIDFDIPEQRADRALTKFAEQADLTLMVPHELVQDRQANELIGEYTLREGIKRLLSGTGLTPEFSSAIVLNIKAGEEPANGGQTMTVSKKAGLLAVLAGIFAGEAGSQEDATSGETIQQLGVLVSGTVKASGVGANLKGAQIVIVETGQKTATDDLGRFRFSSVVAGDYTLRITYLGYQEILAPIKVAGEPVVDQTFEMTGGYGGEEIIVYGSRSARAQALNQERTASNSLTVLAGDFLGQFEGDTISDALRRAPGIAFEEDPLTGDGTNVIVRGLEPDLNQVTLNGLRLPEGTGIGRSANLGNILTESISKVTISKSLLPSQDGAGAGGLIEIETKGPLDRPRRFASFSAEGTRSDGDFLQDYLLSGTAAGTFGADESLGLSASVQLRQRDIQQIAYGITLSDFNSFGQYLPADKNGVPISNPFFIDLRNPFPFEPGLNEVYPSQVNSSYNSVQAENFALTLSGQWRIGNHTELKFDYTRADETRDTFARSASYGVETGRELLPVDSLGGEPRYALVAEDVFAGFGIPGIIFSPTQNYSNEVGVENTTSVYSFRGETTAGKWSFDYALGSSRAKSTTPRSESLNVSQPFASAFTPLNTAFILPEALSNTVDGRVVQLFSPLSGNRFPLPLLNQAGYDFFDNPSNYEIVSGSILTGASGINERDTSRFSARFDVDWGYLKYIEAGAFFERSEFRSGRGGGGAGRFEIGAPGVSLADLGIDFARETLADIGLDGGFRVISEADILALFAGAELNPDLQITPVVGSGDPRLAQVFTREDNFAAYLQARIDVGRLEMVGGVRLERVKIDSRNLTTASLVDEFFVFDQDFRDRFSTLVDQAASQTELLPRIAVTYRQSDNLLFRAGYGVTVARPQIVNLSDQQIINVSLFPNGGLMGNQPTFSVTQGNPDLEPARTRSYDLSGEYYFDSVGVVEVSVFYKTIENLLEQNLVTTSSPDILEGIAIPDDPRIAANLDNFAFIVTTPFNNETKAEIWGVEAAFERQLTFLPGALDGFGIFLNYTYTDSEKTQPAQQLDPATFEVLDLEIERVPFNGAPAHSGTGAITYNNYGFDVALSYTTQSRRLLSFQRFNLHEYHERDESLDFRAEYRFEALGGDLRVWLEGADLLKGRRDPDVESSRGGTGPTQKIYTGGNFLGGRTLSLGIAAAF